LFRPAVAAQQVLPPHGATGSGQALGLVQLQGPGNAYQRLFAQYREIQPLFVQSGLQISRVSVNDRRALSLELNNGIRINFGRISAASDIYSMAARFLHGYEKELKERVALIKAVDLRYTNGFANQISSVKQ
jgi:cell division protein FtsQ